MRSERRRLHPAAWLVDTLASLREALLPAVIAVVLSGRGLSGATLIGVLAVALSAVAGYVRWQRTAYWLDDDALHFVSGVFTPDHKTVPLARITAVDDVQGPVQRLFSVVALHVQTAGGAAHGEIVLSAVGGEEAARLRAALGREAAADAVPDWRLSGRALLVAAVTGPQIGVVAPFVAAVAGVLPQFLGEDDLDVLERIPEMAGGWERVAVAAVAAVVLLALAGAVVAFGGFTVHRDAERLRIRRGVLQRRAASIGIERVHAVRVVEGFVRRPLGLCAVRLEVAGYAQEPAAAQTLVPLCRRRDVRALLARLLPELPVPDSPPQRPPARGRRRYAVVPAVTGAALGATATLAAGLGFWGAAVGALAAGALGAVRAASAGWWLADGTVAVRRHHVFARATTVAAARRLQHVETRVTPPQRRARLGDLRLAVASGHRTGVRHLERAVADDLLGRLRSPSSRDSAGSRGRTRA